MHSSARSPQAPASFQLTLIGLLVLLALIANPSLARADSESTLTVAPFGSLSIYRPAGPIEGVVLFVSGDGGWHRGVVDMAHKLTAMNALVIGVDIRRYLESLSAPQAGCRSLAIDFENLSHRVQRELGLPEYHVPILAGYSSGATVVYATLAQAPAGTFAGAISLGFCPDQDLRGALLCPGPDLKFSRGKDGSYVFEPASHLQEPWVALQGDQDAVCNPATTAAFAAQTSGASLIALPKVGHGFSVERNWVPQFQDAYQRLITTSQRTATVTGEIADLPLTEVVAQPRSGRLAILLTGDGGWAGLDRELAARLAAAGVSVVGFNSLKYYWTARTPEQSAADVARVIEHYTSAWQVHEVLLIGYSFGADVLPFIVNRLSADLQRQIRAVSLLGPSRFASFEVRVADWLPRHAKDGASIAPEIARMPGVPILCLYGEGESDTLCPDLPAGRAKVATVGKGHHFGGDYDAIAASVLAFSTAVPTISSAIHRRQSEMILKAARSSM